MPQPPPPDSQPIAVSILVDALPEYYYKAELLLFSLRRFAGITARHIIVHCVDRVDGRFKRFVEDAGYTLRVVEPYLDGQYCNKLQQLVGLTAVLPQNLAGVLLLDVDMVALAPLSLPVLDQVLGKIVDAPNPPLEVLAAIFAAAGIAQPAQVLCDWQTGPTLAGNFNGGFIYVPTALIAELGLNWRQWAQWLYARPELFETPSQRIHIDQVSLALALAASGLPHGQLAANYNFPGHANRLPGSYLPEQPLRVLHYHWEISAFGHINTVLTDHPPVQAAIARLNQALAEHQRFCFYGPYKKALCGRLPACGQHFGQLRAALAELGQRFPNSRLLLHAGTPKTGTTTLQYFCDQHRQALAAQGVWYAPIGQPESKAPKHQWLVNVLRADDELAFAERIRAISAEPAPTANIHTLMLSTEGLFNHWWDYSPDSKAMLALFTEFFAVEVWLWLRPPTALVSSLYRQYLGNPPCMPCYGQDWSVAEMLQDHWFVRHLDYLGFIYELQAWFGQTGLRLFNYQGDTVDAFKQALGLTGLPSPRLENLSLGAVGVELLRVVNRQPLPFAVKAAVSDKIKEIDQLMATVAERPFQLSADDLSAIARLTALQQPILAEEFGLAW